MLAASSRWDKPDIYNSFNQLVQQEFTSFDSGSGRIQACRTACLEHSPWSSQRQQTHTHTHSLSLCLSTFRRRLKHSTSRSTSTPNASVVILQKRSIWIYLWMNESLMVLQHYLLTYLLTYLHTYIILYRFGTGDLICDDWNSYDLSSPMTITSCIRPWFFLFIIHRKSKSTLPKFLAQLHQILTDSQHSFIDRLRLSGKFLLKKSIDSTKFKTRRYSNSRKLSSPVRWGGMGVCGHWQTARYFVW